MTPTASANRALEALARPVVEDAGCDLERISVSPAGRRSVVRVIVDADGGVSLDVVARISRALSAELDAAEEQGRAVLPGAYVLEVTSPGVDRPLTEERHWRRNVGRLVRVVPEAGRPMDARIVAVGDGTVTLAGPDGERTMPLEGLGPGRIQIEFGHADELPDEPEPGTRAASDAAGALVDGTAADDDESDDEALGEE